jgi:hypothetical protein
MILDLLRTVAILVAAVLLGNGFLRELKKAQRTGAPWYRPYLSPPGLLILLAVFLAPVLIRCLH